ncbi:MAG TPA: serine/threonine protein kinase [Planctomycetes bacterium]|nr:serine/threonine protein kinase [Planctomycetota bacterium]
MAVTVEQFVKNLVRSHLFSPEEAVSLLERVPGDQSDQDARALADQLVEAGRLTSFQASMLYEGRTRGLVLGEYTLLDRIGSGGMGEVFRARHRTMERVVAIKALRRGASDSPSLMKRFQREVRAAGRLMHPNIVTALDASHQDGIWYLVMEYVDGQDLAELVRRRGPLAVEEAVDYVCQVARGLHYAHTQGIVHRDIKPRNLLVDKSGTVKILDMGLARISAEATSRPEEELTASEKVLGTFDYLAPEQAEDARMVDRRADIYSLGCTLYHLLVGKPPYKRSSALKTVLAHREAPIPSICQARPDLPPALDAVFRKMVAKRPEDRYQDMGQVEMELQRAVGRREEPQTVTAAPRPPADPELASFLQHVSGKTAEASRRGPDKPAARSTGRPTPQERLGDVPEKPVAGRRRQVIMAIGIATLLTCAVLLLAFFAGRQRPSTEEPGRIDETAGRGGQPHGTGQATLILFWSAAERKGATLKIDGQPQDLHVASGDAESLRLSVAPGQHTIHIERPGFEPFRRRFLVDPGEQFAIEPTWRARKD